MTASFARRSSLFGAPLLLLALGACATAPYDVTATRCDPARHQVLVGKNIGEVLLPPNLRKREVGPQGVMTRDFNPARLTMFLDAKGWITRVACS